MNLSQYNLQKIRNLLRSNPSAQPVSPERREFVKTLGASALAANPIINSLTSFTNQDFEVKHTKHYFAIIQNEQIVWEIHPDFFGKSLSIKVVDSDNQIVIKAKNLRIIHTNLSFDMHAVITKELTHWRLHIQIPQFDLDNEIDFSDWINGIRPISSTSHLNTRLISLNQTDHIDLKGLYHCQINHRWHFKFKGNQTKNFRVLGEDFTTQSIQITPEETEANDFSSLITEKTQNGVRISINGNENWKKLIENIHIDHVYKLEAGTDQPSFNFSVLSTENNNTFRALWITDKNGKLRISNKKDAAHFLHFSTYFYVLDYNRTQPEFFLTAKMSNADQWINNPIGSFNLTGDKEKSDLELFGIQNRVTQYRLTPVLNAFQPNISGAIAVASAQNDTKITIHSKPQKVKTPKLSVLSTDGDKLEYIPDTSIKIKVVRPDDMMFLEFEFHNFKFKGLNHQFINPGNLEPVKVSPVKNRKIQVTPLKTKVKVKTNSRLKPLGTKPKIQDRNLVKTGNTPESVTQVENNHLVGVELADPQKKGIVVVYFPTQHTLEEAYYEASTSAASDPVKLPARHIRAQKSRLVYELKNNLKGFDLSIEALLDWSKFSLRVDKRAWIELDTLPTLKQPTYPGIKIPVKNHTRYLDKQEIQYAVKVVEKNKIPLYENNQLNKVLIGSTAKTLQPNYNVAHNLRYIKKVEPIDALHTAIEAPALLYISPNQINDFYHRIAIKTPGKSENFRLVGGLRQKPIYSFSTIKPADKGVYTDRITFPTNQPGEIVELWHTRLGVKTKDGKTADVLPKLKTIRALWAFEASADASDDQALNQPFRASLDANNRQKLVHLTSNYNISNYKPEPVTVKKLILSNLGAYIDWQAKFKTPAAANNLNIIAWEHLATLGRDHYVKIVEAGYLFPFGHKASLVTVTERKFDKGTKAAVNKQRKFVVIVEDTVHYHETDPNDTFIKFPFQEIKIIAQKTPFIDKPESASIIKDGVHKAFLINVAGKGFKFDIISTDKEGKEHHLRMPLAFVENGVALNKALISKVINNYHKSVYDTYTKVAYNGQDVAFAKSLIGGETNFETKSIQFGATTYPAKHTDAIKFHPIMRIAEVYIDAIDKITNSKKPVQIALEDDRNKGSIFASVMDTVIDFTGGSESSGGFLTPNMPVNALSKIQGAVGGALHDLKNLHFNPSDVFKELDNLPVAKIFGAIKLLDLLLDLHLGDSLSGFVQDITRIREDIEKLKNDILFIENKNLEKIKKAAESEKEALEKKAKQEIQTVQDTILSKVEELLSTLKNQAPKIPNLKTYVTETAFFAEYKFQPQFKGKSITIIPELLKVSVANPQKGMSISTLVKKPFAIAEMPSIKTAARFNKFAIDIVPLLKVSFNYLEFNSGSDIKTDVKVDMDGDNPIEFKGALSFVNSLQNVIPNTGFSEDGPYIDLQPTGVKAGFNISVPDIEVGVCNITNMTLGAYVMLPFTGAPLTMGFNFCTRNNPFLLTVSGFGGGGYFLMVTTLNGIQSMEAAFEFGAAMSLNVGVASGSVSVMGGFYFKMELVEVDGNEVSDITLSGYLRMNGRLSVLGLINVSLEFYLSLDAVIVDGKVEKMVGVASLKVKVEVLFFSKTVSITVRRELQGADADPKFIEMITPDDWQEYCLAFAG